MTTRINELGKIFEESTHLESKTELELIVLNAVLNKDETPMKEMKVKTLDENKLTVGNDKKVEQVTVDGKLLITDKRLIFITDDTEEVVSLSYEMIDGFVSGFNEEEKSEGVLVIYSGDLYYTFFGLTRFGLRHWEEYVNEKIEESFS